MRLIVIRPEPGATSTAAAAHTRGLDIEVFPLSAARASEWSAPDPEDFDALLIGSANVFRLGGAWMEAFRKLPVHAVGQTTAEAARAAGFRVDFVGEGGLQSILDAQAGQEMRYLRLGGAERVAVQPAPGTVIEARTVYEIAHLPIPAALADMLRKGEALVLLHSAGAARHFADECDRLGIARAGIGLVCLGPRIAETAGEGWATIASAPQPGDAALLALAAKLV
ncbi:uroporphyrinogen-III synthase [Aurantiacibacter suaedae]|uniref:uroporphyrinogen-III synthase n=1 Tax=Aurantiacibacter suaedae TaxID=2545755 RepID=UPI0010F59BAB|nr:uroporphyrinogen-III synthase [Aurantiacibacter suaedae]